MAGEIVGISDISGVAPFHSYNALKIIWKCGEILAELPMGDVDQSNKGVGVRTTRCVYLIDKHGRIFDGMVLAKMPGAVRWFSQASVGPGDVSFGMNLTILFP